MQKRDARKNKADWNWSNYFAYKKQKLDEQYAADKRHQTGEEAADLFKNIGIFVNGYTKPTALELKAIMLKHGGSFHEYMSDRVTYIIAANLAYSKAAILKNKLVIRPEWITDCVREKKLLKIEPYLLVTSAHDKAQNKLTSYIKDNKLELISEKPKRNSKEKKDERPVLIDLSDSPEYQEQEEGKNDETVTSSQTKDYEIFRSRLKQFEPKNFSCIDRNQIEIEALKNMLSDWVSSTCVRNRDPEISVYFIIDEESNDDDQSEISKRDVNIFKNYLMHLLVNRDLEKLTIAMKAFKRLVYKNESPDWISVYKDMESTVQSEFFIKYDHKLDL